MSQFRVVDSNCGRAFLDSEKLATNPAKMKLHRYYQNAQHNNLMEEFSEMAQLSVSSEVLNENCSTVAL